MTVQEKAMEYLEYFKTGERNNGDKYIYLDDNRPEELQELVYTCHAGALPDDYTYQWVEDALAIIADSDNPEDAEIEPDIYTSDLTTWLGSRNDRLSYLDEAISQLGSNFGAFDMLQYAQHLERREVFDMVLETLQRNENR